MRTVLIILILYLHCSYLFAKPVEWHMVNVNNNPQGDAHLLIDNGIISMIDVGDLDQSKQYLLPYLRTKGITTIHHLFITHPHDDHFGGITTLILNEINIENIYYSRLPSEVTYDDRLDFQQVLALANNNGIKIRNINKGFSLNLPSSRFKILHAHKNSVLDGLRLTINDYSLIIQWDVNEFRTLFTGDLGSVIGSELAKYKYYKADILKVPHHGVTDIAPNSFFDTVKPKLNMFPSTLPLWTHHRINQSKSWTLNSKIYFCNNGLNGTVVLSFIENFVYANSRKPTSNCPNGRLNIIPGKKINAFDITPALQLLLNEN